MLSKSGIIINGKDLCDVVDDRILTDVKHFSNRSHTSALLKLIRAGIEDMTCGESFYVTHPEDIFNLVENMDKSLLKRRGVVVDVALNIFQKRKSALLN